jgi:hypothetical protein
MSLTIEQIEEQIANLQQTLETLKNPKLEVARSFTGQYFSPYQGRLYRRMESDGVPIWETYLDIKKEWVLVQSQESRQLEKTYLSDCVTEEEPIEGIIESSMK